MTTLRRKIFVSFAVSAAFVLLSHAVPLRADNAPAADLKTGFQEWDKWQPGLNLPADVAMVYGNDPAKIRAWSEHGYTPWSMFSASWLGKDEQILKDHPEIVQTLPGGVPFEMIKGRSWVVPVGPWTEHVEKMAAGLVANGARAILPEEPEFFASTGYSAAFKKEWQSYYGEPWKAPNSSLTSQWKANKLKGYLFTEFYSDLFEYLKALDPDVKRIIPAHSNLNYADWGIVSPHHAYMQIPSVDGFIGQVWTGTAKGTYPVGGKPVRSAADYSFLEYSYFANLTAGTKKAMWFLTDPVEDEPGAQWDTLRGWYEDTLVSALMQPSVNHYEIAPWPSRFIVNKGNYGGKEHPDIPNEYATELMTVWAAQRKIPSGGAAIESGSNEIGFLTADSLMWQRGSGRDRFKGHVAPMLSLLRHGIFVNVLPAERFYERNFPPRGIRLIVASFDAWKPETPAVVEKISEWVKGGGTLVFIGGDDDYDKIDGVWWRTEGDKTPADVLLDRLSIGERKKLAVRSATKLDNKILAGSSTEQRVIKPGADAPDNIKAFASVPAVLPITAYGVDGAKIWMKLGEKPVVWELKCGEGRLIYAGFPGETIAQLDGGEKLFFEIIRAAAAQTPGMKFAESDKLIVRRGPFVVARSVNGPLTLNGPLANILRPGDEVKTTLTIPEKTDAFALDIMEAEKQCPEGSAPCILLAGGNVGGEKPADGNYEFTLAGPPGRFGGAWIYFPGREQAPESAKLSLKETTTVGASGLVSDWDQTTKTLHLIVPLSPDGTIVKIEY